MLRRWLIEALGGDLNAEEDRSSILGTILLCMAVPRVLLILRWAGQEVLVQWCRKPVRFPLIESPQGVAGPLFEPNS